MRRAYENKLRMNDSEDIVVWLIYESVTGKCAIDVREIATLKEENGRDGVIEQDLTIYEPAD